VCPVAGALWNWIFKTFGIHWVISGTVADLLHSWWNGLGRHSSDIWNVVPTCLMWTIWKERNQRTFEDVFKVDNQILEALSKPSLTGLNPGDFLVALLFLNLFLLCT
jgi:hypothetical protein